MAHIKHIGIASMIVNSNIEAETAPSVPSPPPVLLKSKAGAPLAGFRAFGRNLALVTIATLNPALVMKPRNLVTEP